MPLEDSKNSPCAAIDAWFRSRCDGEWEQLPGVTLTTTDNPGWWLTFRGMSIPKEELAGITGEMLNVHDAQVTFDATCTRVYSPRLESCIKAAAMLSELALKADRD